MSRRPLPSGAVQAAQAWRIPKAAPLVAEGRGAEDFKLQISDFKTGFPASGHRQASWNAAHEGNRDAGGKG